MDHIMQFELSWCVSCSHECNLSKFISGFDFPKCSFEYVWSRILRIPFNEIHIKHKSAIFSRSLLCKSTFPKHLHCMSLFLHTRHEHCFELSVRNFWIKSIGIYQGFQIIPKLSRAKRFILSTVTLWKKKMEKSNQLYTKIHIVICKTCFKAIHTKFLPVSNC